MAEFVVPLAPKIFRVQCDSAERKSYKSAEKIAICKFLVYYTKYYTLAFFL